MINLIVAAHPDDEILGFGGSGLSLTQKGEKVIPLILCGDVNARGKRPENKVLKENISEAFKIVGFSNPIFGNFENLKMNLVPHLELVKFIEKFILELRPNKIFTHHPNDLNNDHKQVSNACMAASRIFQRKNEVSPINGIYLMEILSSSEWAYDINNNIFSPNIFIDIKDTIHKKIEALSCYKDVMRASPHPRSKEVILAHSKYRGTQSGFEYAEAFQLIYSNKL